MASPPDQFTWPRSLIAPVFRAGRSTQRDRGFEQVYQNDHLTLHLFAHKAAMRIGAQTFDIEPGDVTLTPPHAEERFDFINDGFHWHLRLVPDPGWAAGTLPLRLHYRLQRHALEARQRIEAVARDVRLAGDDRDHPAAWSAAAGSHALLCWLAALQIPRLARSQADRCVDKAATMLGTLECADMSIAEISRRVGMSQNRLAKAFQARHAITMAQFRTRFLIDTAKWLMESTDLPLAAIRRRIQIANAQRFNKLFRKSTGLSPREWLAAHAPVLSSMPVPQVPIVR
jgi:AraC-like DNA-binding protein